MNKKKKPILLLVGTILNLIICILFSIVWYKRCQLPYNELGRYYDGQVVWHGQSTGVYGVISMLFFILTIVFTYLLVKKLKHEST